MICKIYFEDSDGNLKHAPIEKITCEEQFLCFLDYVKKTQENKIKVPIIEVYENEMPLWLAQWGVRNACTIKVKGKQRLKKEKVTKCNIQSINHRMTPKYTR